MSRGDDRAAGTRIRLRPGELKQAPARDWMIRFAFGAGVSAIAGLVSATAGPRVGGVFLAFPAILLASLTLVAKEDGPRLARDDARGATLGTLGLAAFAVVVAVTLPRWPLWASLCAATAAWALVSLGGYAVARSAGAGGDESPDTSARLMHQPGDGG
jgi:uncharacterized membrane protein (GlpM family)